MKKKKELVGKIRQKINWKNLPILLGLLVMLLTLPLVVLEVQKRKEIRAPAAGQPMGPIVVQMAVDEFLDNPIPGVQTLVVFETKEKVDRAHERGYSVLAFTWSADPEKTFSEEVCRQIAQTGADALVTDEIVLRNNYPEGLQEAVRKFNRCKEAAKAVNPDILVGDVEAFWEHLKAFMENGANPDFVGGEVYNGDINLEKLNQLKQNYGVKTHQWLHGVDPERDLKYVGQVDFAIFADVHGWWDCMNQDCGPYLEELREWAGPTATPTPTPITATPTPTPTPPPGQTCNCGSWQNRGCGGGTCSSNKMYQAQDCYWSD